MKNILPVLCLLLISRIATSQEWVRQNPFPFLSQMYDIDFDGPYGLAVGTDATIYTTTNKGLSWLKEKATDSTRTLTSVLIVPGTGGKTLLAGGNNNVILSVDGGKFWKTTHNYLPNVFKIEVLADGTWIAMGSDFAMKSTDKGKFWFAINMPGMGVTAGHFIDVNHGWVAYGLPFNQQVYITSDGGYNWIVRDAQKFSLVNSIQMVNSQVGYLASTDFIFKTIDGGFHWTSQQDIASDGGITDLHVVNESSLWASLNDGAVYFSDGGVWYAIDPKLINTNKTLGVWANGTGDVWLVGKYSSILHSADFGKTWADQIPAAKETMFKPNFFNEFVGMVGASDGTIMRTTNSGAKWEKLNFSKTENFKGLEMVDDNVVVAGSASGKVFFSENQGNTWSIIGQNLGPISDLKAFNRYEIIVTNENGKIYKTTDGGATWNSVYYNVKDHLLAIDFLDHQRGWASGTNGKVLATVDGGETWSVNYNEKVNKFSDIHFITPLQGWIVSSSATDTIWHTNNGGQTWLKNGLPIKTDWQGISFMDQNTGWIAGGSDGYGIVLRTDNGGNTWYKTHESPDGLLGIFAIPGQEAVWAVGYGGNIVKYASCSMPPMITDIRVTQEPCSGDTVSVVAEFTGVDKFEWTYPADWLLIGNPNSSTIQFIAGTTGGQITLKGSDACLGTSVELSATVTPVPMPVIVISQDQDILVSNINTGFFQWYLDGSPIQGATDFSFRPILSGTYQLHYITFTSGCTTQSNELVITISPLQNAEWVRQNPFPFLSQMYDIDFDGKYGLAVGADAAIFTTTNGGKTWIQNKATDSTRVLTTAYVVPGTGGQEMLAGGNNNLIITDNGGKLWKTSHNYIPNVYKIESLTDGTLIALGSDFGLKSTDNGLIWFPILMPGMGVTAGHFTSLEHGWVSYGSFDNAQVYITTNGGNTWSTRDSLKYPSISSIDMINDDLGFLASRDYVYKTTDGGNTWDALHPISVDAGITDLHVADESNLWTSLNNGDVYFSTNGGASWKETNPNVINSNKALGIYATINGEAWLVGKYISVVHTDDYGVTWNDQIPASKETMFEPNFYNEFIGMVGGSDGTIMRTKNSGAKWEPVKFPRNENFFGLNMVNDKVVLAGSSSGKVFLSEDQGDSWTTVGQNLGKITDLYAFNKFEIFVTTQSGKIYHTDDGGSAWNTVYNNANDELTAIQFVTHQRGWAAGNKGTILTSNDGGETWQQQYQDGLHQFSDVHFTSETDGWVVSSSITDTIWHTSDGGQNWATSELPVTTFWNAISFMNQDIGWVTGGSNGYGVVLRTDNGGASWYLSHESPDALMGIYAVPGQETVWAVGFGGNIVKYSACSVPPEVSEIRGNLEPCVGDTVNFIVDFSGVDLFDWTFPSDWFVVGNSNTSSINFIAGTESGNVTVRGRDACGDSTTVLSSSVNPVIPPEVFISENNGNLMTDAATGFFEWLFNGVPIPGANEATYHPTVSGTYQLHITTFTSGCEAYSNQIEFLTTGTKDMYSDRITVYPNPASTFISINYSNGKSLPQGSKISLIDMEGKVVMRVISGSNSININGVPSGVYSVRIQTGNEILLKKVVIE
ncbi:MAG: YCF48-related protein [Saprospiraceae bacterium]